MIRYILFVFITVLFFTSGCAKAPEKTGIEELASEISGEVEAERAEKCGDGVKDEWEECDFEGFGKCSSYDIELIGQLQCYNCKVSTSLCLKKEKCDLSHCSGNGACIESLYSNYEVFCQCYENKTGNSCEKCKDEFHFDLDGTCISDGSCTNIGCELEKEVCVISNGRAKCQCKYPWTGEECKECLSNYYYSDGECKSKRCSSGELECGEYEMCFDGNGKPECVCAGKYQDPNDCSKCLPDYDFINYGDFCINEKEVNCRHNPDAAENSIDIAKNYTVTYTDANGWTEPAYCKWTCPENSYFKDNKCNLTLIETAPYIIKYPIGIDKNGVLYGCNYNEIFSISGKTSLLYSVGDQIWAGRFGPGNNIYLNMGGHGIIDTENWTDMIFKNLTTSAAGNMSILKNGKVTYGNSIIEKTERIKIDADYN